MIPFRFPSNHAKQRRGSRVRLHLETLEERLALSSWDLAVTEVSVDPTSVFDGQRTTVTATVRNIGTAGTPSLSNWSDFFYLSNDPILDASDSFLGLRFRDNQDQSIPPGGSYSFAHELSVHGTSPGTKYLFVVADGHNSMPELNDSNNAGSATITLSPINLTARGASAPPVITPGQNATLTLTVENTGAGPAERGWYNSVYLSEDPLLDAADLFLGARVVASGSPIPVGGTLTSEMTVSIPPSANPDWHYLIFVVDSDGDRLETDESDNVWVLDVNLVYPDLAIESASAPSTVSNGEPFAIDYAVTNLATAQAAPSWTDSVYLSTDALLDGSDRLLQNSFRSTVLAAGASYSGSLSVQIQGPVSGARFLLLVTDRTATVAESNETNNLRALPIFIGLPDLVLTSASAPAGAASGSVIGVSYTISNQGPVPAFVVGTDGVYLSDDAAFDTGDLLLDRRSNGDARPLGAGSQYTVPLDLRVPNISVGPKFLLFLTDTERILQQYESDEENNFLALPFDILANQPPSLEPIAEQFLVEAQPLIIPYFASDPDLGQILPATVDTSAVPVPTSAFVIYPTSVTLFAGDDAPGAYPVVLSIRDNGFPPASTSQTFLVHIANAAPVVSHVNGPTSGVRGQNRIFSLSAYDPGLQDYDAGFTFDIDWDGDGTVDQSLSGPSGFQVGHVFPTTGTFTIGVTARDKDGAVSPLFTRAITIVDWETQFNESSGLTDLAWGGSNLADELLLYTLARDPVPASVYLRDLTTGQLTSVPGVTGKVLLFGQGGDDRFLGGHLTNQVEFYGGAGDDLLIGGTGSDFLDGGGGGGGGGNDFLLGGIQPYDGRDSLDGGDGRDILIGQNSFDSLKGGAGEDLLIGDVAQISYVHPADLDWLADFRASWNSPEPIAQRVLALEPLVLPNVSAGGEFDLIDGGADTDWLVTTTNDSVIGAAEDIRSTVNAPLVAVSFFFNGPAVVGVPLFLFLEATGSSSLFTFQITYADRQTSVTQSVIGPTETVFEVVIDSLGDSNGEYGFVVTATDATGRVSLSHTIGVVLQLASQSRSPRELGAGMGLLDEMEPNQWLEDTLDPDAVDEAFA